MDNVRHSIETPIVHIKIEYSGPEGGKPQRNIAQFELNNFFFDKFTAPHERERRRGSNQLIVDKQFIASKLDHNYVAVLLYRLVRKRTLHSVATQTHFGQKKNFSEIFIIVSFRCGIYLAATPTKTILSVQVFVSALPHPQITYNNRSEY